MALFPAQGVVTHKKENEGDQLLTFRGVTVMPSTPEMMQKLDDVKWDMLDEWSKSKKTSHQAKWLHEKEFR